MKSLININESVSKIVSWVKNPKWDGQSKDEYLPEYGVIANAARVCQVEQDSQVFPVAEPLFWVDCSDNVIADCFYYDTVNKTIQPIVNAPYPETN
jgi:hypothetical protein